MGISIFRRKFVIRRFQPQKIIRGHAISEYTDIFTALNVQPLTPNELKALPEGERSVKHLKAFGDFQLTAADQMSGTPGDWLWYYGRWYKCISAAPWGHTLLAHCESKFVAVAESDPSLNLEPPKGNNAGIVPGNAPVVPNNVPTVPANDGKEASS